MSCAPAFSFTSGVIQRMGIGEVAWTRPAFGVGQAARGRREARNRGCCLAAGCARPPVVSSGGYPAAGRLGLGLGAAIGEICIDPFKVLFSGCSGTAMEWRI